VSLGLIDRRDVEFLLRDVFRAGQLFETEPFKEQSWETFEMILDQAIKFAHEKILPTMVDGDRIGCTFDPDNGAVTTPDSLKDVYKAYCEAGWIAIAEPEELGGFGLPKSLAIQAICPLISSNISFFFGPGLSHGAGEMIAEVGTPEQIATYVPKLYTGEWGGTMCLTEASAGSDVGSARTTAVQQPDGTWHIKGQKIFITYGEHDLTDNIVYPVLARVEGDPAGTKGISLFLVSKYHLNADGSLGERNGVRCTGIEHKLGIHASPTCTMAFGEDTPAVGELLGERCGGLKAMFKMMNTARIAVGLQALTLSEAAYRYAHQYAIDRQQGASIDRFKDPTAPRVSIIKHPDVRRMLLDQRSIVEGLRALLTYCAFLQDLAHSATDEAARAEHEGVLALLTPLAKGYASEVGFQSVSDSLLVLGGHGYLRDHPIEQYLRDMVIARIYEGTTGIQAMDLVGRKLGMKGGMVLMTLLGRIDQTVAAAREAGLGGMADCVEKMRNTVGQTAMTLGGRFMEGDLTGPLLHANNMLHLFGDTVVSWLHLWMATEARQEGEHLEMSPFLNNKIRSARHFVTQAVQRVTARAGMVGANDRAPLDFAFEGEDEV
jgi:alkylation response protein AidB-like acyl-CoA dehydrogenase